MTARSPTSKSVRSGLNQRASRESTGPVYITRDNGFSGTLDVSLFKTMDVLIAYNHSVRYAPDTVSFTVQFNANSLLRKLTNR